MRSCACAIANDSALPLRDVQLASILSGKWIFPNFYLAVTGFDGSATNCRIEGSNVCKSDCRQIVLYIVVLGVVTFRETAIEVLHESLCHSVGAWVVRSGRYLANAEITIHRCYDAFD